MRKASEGTEMDKIEERTKRDITVGMCSGPTVCLYDVRTNSGTGIDIYFDSWDDVIQTANEIARQAHACKEAFGKRGAESVGGN